VSSRSQAIHRVQQAGLTGCRRWCRIICLFAVDGLVAIFNDTFMRDASR
jgi:hypothetical protein